MHVLPDLARNRARHLCMPKWLSVDHAMQRLQAEELSAWSVLASSHAMPNEQGLTSLVSTPCAAYLKPATSFPCAKAQHVTQVAATHHHQSAR